MRSLDNFSCRLGGRDYRPLMQGGMGVDISTAALALEIARLGGIGHISDAMSPYLSDKYLGTKLQSEKSERYKEFRNTYDKSQVKWDLDDLYTAQKRYIQDAIASKRGEGAVHINVMEKLTMGNPKETLRARLRGALDAGIEGITLSAGLHLGTLKLVEDHPRFRDVRFGIIVSSARALKLFLQSAAKVNRVPDYVVVEGPLAGGHLGFGLDWEAYDLRSIVLDVLEFLKANDLSIPVIPAGGIFTSDDAAEFLSLGASAVQVATRFTISRECGLPPHVKQEYLRSQKDDVVVNLSSPTGYPMRMLKSSPSLQSNIKPNCEALGYLLDRDGNCAYHDAYERTGVDERGRKLPVTDKMCICYHFMKCQCYTCGGNVFRLKDTTHILSDGQYYLPSAEEVFLDYMGKVAVKQSGEHRAEGAKDPFELKAAAA